MNLRLKQRVLKRGEGMTKKCLRNILYSYPIAIRKKNKANSLEISILSQNENGKKKNKQPPTIAGMGVGNRKPLFTGGGLANWSRHMEFKVENT